MTKTERAVVRAWAIMDGDQLARIFVSDHRWNIYDSRDTARFNLSVMCGSLNRHGFRVQQVEIRVAHAKSKKGKR